MRRIVWDLESNGLLEKATVIHSLVLRDLDSDAVLSCTDSSPGEGYGTLAHGLELLAEADLIVGHNVIKFDIPLIKKLYPGWTTSATVRDTLILSRYLYAHISDGDFVLARQGRLPGKLIGSHSLKAWGYRLGVLKGSYAEEGEGAWDNWSEAMQRYCEQDTVVTKTLLSKTDCGAELYGNTPACVLEHDLAWYLAAQERNGIPFNMDKAISLAAKLSARREDLAQSLRLKFGTWETVDKVFTPKRDNKKLGYTAGVPVTKMKTVEFNPASRDHIAYVLKERYGWVPKDFTDGGKPKVDDTTLEGLTHIPECEMLREYLLLSKRLGMLSEGKQAWMMTARNDAPEGGLITGLHHIHGSVNQNGAVTHRATHAWPNLAQVPAVGAEYGAECRELFYVPDGWTLLGSDASGLELRCLAHYMARYDDGAYGRIILEGKSEDGTDIHSQNRDALGLKGKEGRNTAKTFIYAYLYGAGDVKIGSILVPTDPENKQKKQGKALRADFEKSFPALKYLNEAVQGKATTLKYIKMPDGRKSHIRSAHAALNTLLQGAGAIICKKWIVEFNKRMTERFGPQGWDGKWAACLWIHDEIQVAVRNDIAEEAATIAVDSIRAITHQLDWRIPLDGEAKLGTNWKETH